jgi:phosphate ABC transporter phosphate-binding protein
MRHRGRGRYVVVVAAVVVVLLAVVVRPASRASADTFVPVSGAGSTWSANALNQWIADVSPRGMRINYAPTGSSDGRHQFLQGTVDFAASDIPFQSHPEDGSAPETPAGGSYAYMPITSGGTTFTYNLLINGKRVTNLRLSGQNIAKIFTGVITSWSDPALASDNPGLTLPNRTITPVVRSDGSGSTAQFTLWMISQFPDVWNAYCQRVGRSGACGETSYYPTSGGMVAQSGDLGVMGYVAQSYSQGAIGYVNYSYALNANFPVAKVLNSAGYYTEPTANNVAVSLLKAQVDTTDVNDPSKYLTEQLNGVYTDSDPRTYPLSSYSYLILPTNASRGSFTTAKGKTLAAFAYYAMCQGQTESSDLGYSPMPINLVQASFDQIKKIPGAVVETIDINSCGNPTFSPGHVNLLADTAPMPPDCDKKGSVQCTTGTGRTGPTAVTPGSSQSSSNSTGTGGANSSTGGASAGAGGTSGGATRATTAPKTASQAGASTAARTGSTAASSARTATGATGATLPSSSACDPSVGSCGAAPAASSDPAATGNSPSAPVDQSSGQAAAPAAVTLAAAKGWTSTQSLMVLLALLLLGLVFAPGLALRYIRSREE